jgi:hypothetical protein
MKIGFLIYEYKQNYFYWELIKIFGNTLNYSFIPILLFIMIKNYLI